MVFSSIEFLWLFMPVVLALYLVVPPRWRNALLAAASLGFYVWGAGALLYLFLGSIAINFVAGHLIGAANDAGDERRAARLTTVAVAVNLLILGFWKYAVFAVVQLDSVVGLFGGEIRAPSIALPIGISFFTFHGISYVVDIHRGRAKPMRSRRTTSSTWRSSRSSSRDRSSATTRSTTRSARLRRGRSASATSPTASRASRSVYARRCSSPTRWGRSRTPPSRPATEGLNSTTAWLGVLAYTVQIYFDFSGYSDMAIGLARMFGFRFPENFNRPYSAVSMTDFWRRWHMSLSRWFRDYVYVPLGGNRMGTRTTIRNLLFVFLLTGLWHGAAWTFVLWGLFHGVLLVIERLTGINALADDRAAGGRRAATLVLVMIGWVLFRSARARASGRLLQRDGELRLRLAPLGGRRRRHAAVPARPRRGNAHRGDAARPRPRAGAAGAAGAGGRCGSAWPCSRSSRGRRSPSRQGPSAPSSTSSSSSCASASSSLWPAWPSSRPRSR